MRVSQVLTYCGLLVTFGLNVGFAQQANNNDIKHIRAQFKKINDNAQNALVESIDFYDESTEGALLTTHKEDGKIIKLMVEYLKAEKDIQVESKRLIKKLKKGK